MTIAIIGAGAMGGSPDEGLLSLKAPPPSPGLRAKTATLGASTTIIATLYVLRLAAGVTRTRIMGGTI